MMRHSGKLGLAVAALSLGLLGGTAAPLPATAGTETKLDERIEWDENPGLVAQWFSHVSIKTDRIAQAHQGMNIPGLLNAEGEPKWGSPYFFFGMEGGKYLPEHLLMCIDVFHDDYHVPEGSAYIDLVDAVPEATAREIHYTINAALEMASARGLVIRTDGSIPLEFTTRESAAMVLAAQVKSWHLYSRDYRAKPMPNIALDDFEPRANDGTIVDLSAEYAALEARVEQYRQSPHFADRTVELATAGTLSDPGLSGFRVALDPESSTPGFEDYVDVTIDEDNVMHLTRLAPTDEPIRLAFTSMFDHSAGGIHLSGAIRAMGQQAKAVVGGYFHETFTVTVDMPPIEVLERDVPEEPTAPLPIVDETPEEAGESPAGSVATPAASANDEAGSLAETGSSVSTALLWSAGALCALGIALVVARLIKRRRQA